MQKLVLFLVLISGMANARFLQEQDKQKHMAVSAVIAGVSTVALQDSEHPILYPMLLTGAVGLGKELYDSRSGGSGFSKSDLVADAIGITVGAGGANFLVVKRDYIGLDFNYRW